MVTSLLWLFCVSVEKWPSGERVMTVRKAPRYRSLEVVHSEGCQADWAHCAFICVIYPWSGGVESKTSLIHYRLIEMKYSSEACPFLHWLIIYVWINQRASPHIIHEIKVWMKFPHILILLAFYFTLFPSWVSSWSRSWMHSAPNFVSCISNQGIVWIC